MIFMSNEFRKLCVDFVLIACGVTSLALDWGGAAGILSEIVVEDSLK